MLLWDDKYTIGIKELDMHHQLLFGYLNSMKGMLGLKDEVTEEAMEKALANSFEFLEMFANEHFETEEGYMEQYHCPTARKNKEEHEKFRGTLQDLKKRFAEGDKKIEVFREAHQLAKAWITDHISEVDSPLKECLPT